MEEEHFEEQIIDEERDLVDQLPEINYQESDYCRPSLTLKDNT